MKRIIPFILALAMLLGCAHAQGGLTEFAAYDISTAVVTEENVKMDVVNQDIFADYDLTMINVWATWCVYCVKEMPELAKLKDMLPENVNVITICTDAASEFALALDILEETGAKNIPTLAPSEEMIDFLTSVAAFPTTYFVDSEGNFVGSPIMGVPSMDNAAVAYASIAEEVLASLED